MADDTTYDDENVAWGPYPYARPYPRQSTTFADRKSLPEEQGSPQSPKKGKKRVRPQLVKSAGRTDSNTYNDDDVPADAEGAVAPTDKRSSASALANAYRGQARR